MMLVPDTELTDRLLIQRSQDCIWQVNLFMVLVLRASEIQRLIFGKCQLDAVIFPLEGQI